MSKFHINAKGMPAPCNAEIKCPFGGETGAENHFNTVKEAQDFIDMKNELEHRLLPEIQKTNVKLHSDEMLEEKMENLKTMMEVSKDDQEGLDYLSKEYYAVSNEQKDREETKNEAKRAIKLDKHLKSMGIVTDVIQVSEVLTTKNRFEKEIAESGKIFTESGKVLEISNRLRDKGSTVNFITTVTILQEDKKNI